MRSAREIVQNTHNLCTCHPIYRRPSPGQLSFENFYWPFGGKLSVALEKQDANLGRAGIMIHGGGSGCGWPGACKPQQSLFSTLGCIRMHNQDLRDKVVPLYDQPGATLFVSVHQ